MLGRRLAGAMVAVLLGLAACGDEGPPSAQVGDDLSQSSPNATAPDSPVTIGNLVIDPNPPSGEGCCLDVLAVGDINGDGRTDVAVGSQSADGAVWYSNPGWQRHPIGDGGFTTDGRLADVNGDGRPDFVVSDIETNSIEWFENPGTADVPGWTKHQLGDLFAHDVVTADVDGDGLVDVVAFRKDKPARVTIYHHPADPTQPWPSEVLADQLPGEGLAAGDADADGRVDIVASHFLFHNDGGGQWTRTDLEPKLDPDVRPAIGDVNGDGVPDIVLGPAERATGGVVWLEGPNWVSHPVGDDKLVRNHTLELGDLDGDHRPDILVGEMHDGGRRVIAYLNQPAGWDRQVLSTGGTHNARLADLDGDGRLDVVGKNYDGPKIVQGWTVAASAQGQWQSAQIDAARGKFGPSRYPYLGLAFGDINGDGLTDIASGRYLYLNPGGSMLDGWRREELPTDADAMWMADLDGTGSRSIIAERLPEIWRFDRDPASGQWTGRAIAEGFAPVEHTNSQGYGLGRVNGSQAIFFTAGDGIWYLTVGLGGSVPAGTRVRIATGTTEDVLALGDVNGDGCVDAVGSVGGHDLMWYADPCDGSGDWQAHSLGSTVDWADRSALADVDGDGRVDLVVSDENGEADGARTYWYQAPPDPTGPWTRHEIAQQASTNSMSVGDVTGDGMVDIVTGEHKGKHRVTVWQNIDHGTAWAPRVISTGTESHLGARLVDLDGRGTWGIVNIGWDEPAVMRLFVRRAASPPS